MKKQAEVRLPVGLLDKLADHSEYLADAILLHLPNPETAKLSQGLQRKQHLYCYVAALAAWRLDRLLNPKCVPFDAPRSQPREAPTDVVDSLEIGGAIWQLRLALDSLLALTNWQYLSELKDRPSWAEIPKQFHNLPLSAPGQLATWFRTIARQLRAAKSIPEILLPSDEGDAIAEAIRLGVTDPERSIPLARKEWALIVDCSVDSTAERRLDKLNAILETKRSSLVVDLKRLPRPWREAYEELIEKRSRARRRDRSK